MAVDQQYHGNGSSRLSDEEWRNDLVESHLLSSSEASIKRQKKTLGTSVLLLIVMAMGVASTFLVMQSTSKSKTNPNDTDDLGQGINNASALRGHLVTRWQQGKTQYQLKIEPIDPRSNDGFALVTGSPQQPISINIRALDSSGFALCGKEILVPFDPAKARQTDVRLPKNKAEADKLLAAREADLQRMRAQEKARESGKDVFQDIAGTDGKIEALWSQGTLPCSSDQYRRFDYWDMTTNFPTISEQQAVMDRKAIDAKKVAAEKRSEAQHKAILKKPLSEFYVEGDDHITAYEPSRTLLSAGPGRSFFIDRKPDQAVVAAWALDLALVHYKCDQHAVCALSHPGSPAVVLGRMNE